MINLTVIASSSAGNAYILDDGTDQLLLECGVQYKRIQEAFGFDFSRLRGCLVTHEHKDHSASVGKMVTAGIDCYMSRGTAEALEVGSHRLHTVRAHQLIQLTGYSVLPFDVQHDAKEPLGYLIRSKRTGEEVVFATDTYYLKYRMKAHYYLVECNYCEDVLQERITEGRVHPALEKRLRESHFSLPNVCDFLRSSKSNKMRKIVLLHLSSGNSDPERMVREVRAASGCDVEVAEPGKEIVLDEFPY